jgi:hypothetical protein
MFIPIVLALGLGGLAIGCGGRSETAAGGGSDGTTPPPPSGSAYAPAAPLIASATPRPNPVATALVAPEYNLVNIGTAPTGPSLAAMAGTNDEERIRTWRDQNAMTGYIERYVTLTSAGLARTDAIEQIANLIESRMSGDRPIRVRYTVNGTERTDLLNETTEGSPNNAVSIFLQELMRTHTEARAEIQAIQARRAARAPGDGGAAVPPRPPRTSGSASGSPRPRPPAPGSIRDDFRPH